MEGEQYTDHANDRGGPTKYGVTKKVLQKFYKDNVITDVDVQNLTKAAASNVYLEFYWKANKLDQIKNPDLAKLLFDQIVNSGAKSVAELAQQVLVQMNFKVSVDGVLGDQTIRVLNQLSFRVFAYNFIKQRQHFYIKLVKESPDQLVFLKGWINRTHTLLDETLKGIL